jgi:hypothetical protein
VRDFPSASFTFAFFLQTHGRWRHFSQGSLGQVQGELPQTAQGFGGVFGHWQGTELHFSQTSGSIGSPSHSGSLKWWCAFTKS